MWPKAISQLVELAPHVSRLLPLADRFLKDKAAGDAATQQAVDSAQQALDNTQKAMEAHRQSIDSLAAGLRNELVQLSTFHNGLEKQIAELDKHLSSTRADALAAKVAAESIHARLAGIEAKQKWSQTLILVAVMLLAAVFVLVAMPYVRAH